MTFTIYHVVIDNECPLKKLIASSSVCALFPFVCLYVNLTPAKFLKHANDFVRVRKYEKKIFTIRQLTRREKLKGGSAGKG